MMGDERPPRLWWAMWKRFLLGGAAIVLVSAAATATAGFEEVQKVANTFARGGARISSPDITPDQAGAPQTIMVIGSDKRALSKNSIDRTQAPRTDTILLLRMDPGKSQTSVLSIPRDLQLNFRDQRGNYYSNAKVNAAYTAGYIAARSRHEAQTAGAKLTVKVVKHLLHIKINHVVDINFAGFRSVVDAVGCVYVDVDRRYYHVTAPDAADNYASINIQPGYQRLCGQTALDYVRYRHTDSDFVRVARQQDFIRQLKDQVGVNGLIDKRDKILSAIGPQIITDIRGVTDTLRLTKLVAFSVGRPVRQVSFRSSLVNLAHDAYVKASPDQIRATVNDFLHGDQRPNLSSPRPAHVSTGHHRRRGHRAARPTVAGLTSAPLMDRNAVISSVINNPLFVYFPHKILANGSIQLPVRSYTLRDEQGHRHHAFRVVFSTGMVGQYWGVQGTDWTDPPILDGAISRQVGRRRFEIVTDGGHIRVVAWKAHRAVYWVSNSLLDDQGLTNPQMLAIASSLAPLQ